MMIHSPPFQIPVKVHPRRRRMALVMTDTGVEVRVPPHASRRTIEAFVVANHAWIESALSRQTPRQTFLWGVSHPLTSIDARDALQVYLSERLPVWSARMGCEPNRVVITNMKSRWGSCSSRGRVAFALNLAQVPKPLVDYVIVHELAHLHEMNHSSRFWAHVAAQLPDYQTLRTQLRDWGRRIGPLQP
ncbi:hypothetical protein SAMN05443662_1415 [Sulfurivirga caldicuralii]|uniref:YgjP-like metallopeptidase domain-containing protein n=1 Tax=Sulfurivirga caldicuralii TaxID=364032 RepID=A0A1N6GMR5_9GAMM|nr:SprT family zinc-dependent metalloprotease [Sulfurivirga caldicuralii]SIO08849.1 hypothetical protein SAMN05443662_1415 [Sulfurivirga caldicuralii]